MACTFEQPISASVRKFLPIAPMQRELDPHPHPKQIGESEEELNGGRRGGVKPGREKSPLASLARLRMG